MAENQQKPANADSSPAIQVPKPRAKVPQQQKNSQKSSKFSNAQAAPPSTLAVIGTSDDAAVSKLSASQLGYFVDPFLKFFVPQGNRRPPLINRGYFSRVAAVSEILQEFCKNPGKKQIFSLGAGSDTNYFRLKAAGLAPTHYFEVDFPSAMEKKAAILEKHPELRALLMMGHEHDIASAKPHDSTTGGPVFDYPDYHLIGADLRDLPSLEVQLARSAIDYSLPTLFLSECVLIYMNAADSRPLIEWSARKFTGGSVFVTYEQIHPNDPFGETMEKNLNARGCGLLAFKDYPDIESHRQRYLSAGYRDYTGWDMNSVYSCYLDPLEIERIEKLELFDEFEEWYMIQGHYHISMARNPPNGRETMPDGWCEKLGFFGRERIPRRQQAAAQGILEEKLSHAKTFIDRSIHRQHSDPSVQHLYPPLDVQQFHIPQSPAEAEAAARAAPVENPAIQIHHKTEQK